MKIVEGFSRKLLTLALALTMLFPTTAITANAATCKDTVSVHTYKNGDFLSGTTSGPIEVQFDEHGDYIANLHSSSDKLKVYVTAIWNYQKKGVIGVWTKTPGKYKVTFDIYGGNGVKKESKTVNVKVRYSASVDYPIKKITYAGKALYGEGYNALNMPKSGKLKVELKKKYKIKKIEIGKWDDKKKTTVYKTFKNGKKLTLNTHPYTYIYNSGSTSTEERNMEASTSIRITYIDKKTKEENYVFSSITRLVNYQ